MTQRGRYKLLEQWEQAALRGAAALQGLCTDPSETGAQLRQASPLTVLLLATERKRIHEAFAADPRGGQRIGELIVSDFALVGH